MWINLLKWLLKFALEQLGENLNAEEKAQVAEYNRKREETEKRRDEAEIELGRIENERLMLLGKRVKQSSEIGFLQEQIKSQDTTLGKLKNEKEQKLTAVRNSDDDNMLHSEL